MVRRAAKRSHDGKKRREKKLIVVAAEGENKTELTYLKEFNRTSIDVFKVTNQET